MVSAASKRPQHRAGYNPWNRVAFKAGELHISLVEVIRSPTLQWGD
jgi:hypothetical protein